MQNQSVSTCLQNSVLVNEEIAWRFTPRRFRKDRKALGIGHIFACLFGLALFMPLAVPYAQSGKTLRMVLLLALLTLVMLASLSLVTIGKRAAIKSARILEEFVDQADAPKLTKVTCKALLPAKQIIVGIIFSSSIILLAQPGPTLNRISLLARISASLSLGYVAFLVGTGFYFAWCALLLIKQWTSARYKIPSLLPYQTLALKDIADAGVWISFLGAIIAMLLSAFGLGLALESGGYRQTYWVVLGFGVVALSWIIISIPFVSSQLLITRMIRRAKEYHLSHLVIRLHEALEQLDSSNKESIESLVKIQGIYEQVYQSRETILDIGIIGKFLSSLLLVALPSIIGAFLK